MDRHARANPDKVALIWEKDEPGQEVRVTYQELQDMASQIGNLLLDQGTVYIIRQCPFSGGQYL